MSLEIVKGNLDMIDDMVVLFNAYRTFYRQPADLDAARSFLTSRIEQNESVVFLARSDGEAAGFMQLYPIFSSVSLKKAWLLNDLYVDAAHRRKGIAKALLQKAKTLGAETNSKWLLLQTQQRNFNAQHLYESSGWIREDDIFYRLDL
jgi:GNAT superfamily N-acetyltransferase